MRREYLLDLAKGGLRMPIGTDLLLHEQPNAEAIKTDGKALGKVVAEAARRYHTPLAIPLMDLTREKEALLRLLGIDDGGKEHHFDRIPDADALERYEKGLNGSFTPAVRAHVESIAHVARSTDLVPVGMSIGPFSLLTKLLADPITPVYLAGSGATAADEPEVALMEGALELSTRLVLKLIQRQIDAGARLIVIAEPAANKVYFSPTQIESGSDVFERYAMGVNRRIRGLLKEANVELFFHCCGELVPSMVKAFDSLDCAIMSLGSSRLLWEDASLVRKSTVLYGNLPSKQFYSDDLVSVADVTKRSRELIGRMTDVKHPFILGTECDVLSVPGCECRIRAKVDAMLAV
jgi:uroporphyrinogen-III decarboxylase